MKKTIIFVTMFIVCVSLISFEVITNNSSVKSSDNVEIIRPERTREINKDTSILAPESATQGSENIGEISDKKITEKQEASIEKRTKAVREHRTTEINTNQADAVQGSSTTAEDANKNIEQQRVQKQEREKSQIIINTTETNAVQGSTGSNYEFEKNSILSIDNDVESERKVRLEQQSLRQLSSGAITISNDGARQGNTQRLSEIEKPEKSRENRTLEVILPTVHVPEVIEENNERIKENSVPINNWNIYDYRQHTPINRHEYLGNSSAIIVEEGRNQNVYIEVTVDNWYYEASWNIWISGQGYYWDDPMTFAHAYETQSITLNFPPGTHYIDCWDTYGDGGISGYTEGATQNASWNAWDYEYYGEFSFVTTDSGTETDPPEFWSVWVIDAVDNNDDGYYEAWTFVVDIDAAYGGIAEDVFINVTTNFGHSWWFGPYDFEGYANWDNVELPFSATNYPNTVVDFFFYAENNAGNDSYGPLTVPIGDGSGTMEPVLLIEPEEYNYGNVLVGISAYNTFVLQNIGTGAFTGSIDLWVTSSDFNIISGGGDFTLAAGQSRNIVVEFAPQISGVQTDFLDVYDTTGSWVVYSYLQGTGYYDDVDTDPPSFWNVWLVDGVLGPCGECYSEFSFEIDIDAASASGVAEDVYINVTTDFGNSWWYGPYDFVGYQTSDNVIVGPYWVSPGFECQDIEFYFYAENSAGEDYFGPITVPVGNPILDDGLVLTPDEYDFGYVPVGMSQFCSFSLINNSNETFVGSADLWETDSDFSIISGGGPLTLAPGASMTIEVEFNPQTPGMHWDYLDINLPSGGYVTFSYLEGYGYVDDMETDPPSFWDVYVIDAVDSNNDGFYESWTFEIDIDALYGNVAEDVFIEISTDLGHSWWFGPYDFVGYATWDNVEIPFNVNNFPNQIVNFFFFAENEAGEDFFGPISLPIGDNEDGEVVLFLTPSTYYFGDVVVGNSATNTFTLSNQGDVPFTGSVGFWIPGTDFNVISGGGQFTIEPGQTRPIVVEFAPQSEGEQWNYLDIYNLDGLYVVDAYIEGNGVIDQDGPAAIEITLSSHTVMLGDEFILYISVSQMLQEWGITSYGFELYYDEDILSFIGIPIMEFMNTLSASGGMPVYNDIGGQINFGWAHYLPIVTDGDDLLALKFQANNPGLTEITLGNFIFNAYNITNIGVSVIEIMEFMIGDVNRDGNVTPMDASVVLQYYVGFDPIPNIDPIPWTPLTIMLADVDLNGMVQPLDASYILQFYVGLIDQLPVQPNRDTGQLATVDAVFENGYLNLYSSDCIYALGIDIPEEFIYSVDNPILYSSSWLSAQNIDSSIYRFAIARAESNSRDNLLLSIPVNCTDIGLIDIYLEINNQEPVKVSVQTLENEVEMPDSFTRLIGNYPNPFNPETKITFSLAQNENVKIEIFNLLGQKITTLINQEMEIGNHSVLWNGRDERGHEVGSGIFFYRMTAGNYSSNGKMILLK